MNNDGVDAVDGTAPTPQETALHELSWGVDKSIRYHEMRQAFFETTDRLVNAITVITGSSAVVALLKDAPSELVISLTALVAIAGITNLTMRSAEMAAKHAGLKQRFVELLIGVKCLDLGAGSAEKQLKKLEVERLNIEKDEPTICRLVDVMAHNEIARAKGYGDDCVWFIPFWARVTAHLRRGDVASLSTVQQHELKGRTDRR